jgi:hypothetical protein
MLSNKQNDAKKCLDKIRYNPKLKESDKLEKYTGRDTKLSHIYIRK